MSSKLLEKVVVITGASSGIGRAAAHAFAVQGCRLVLAARSSEPLEEAAAECRSLGAEAIAVSADVRDPQAVEGLAEQCVRSFGRIDVWVNNAAVSLFGRIEDCPIEDYRRVIDTNFFGYVHGARSAVTRFRNQGHGLLINVASLVAYVGQPYTSAYVSSKFAIRGLSECLRQELADAPDIHVCTVLPGSTDTPLFQHAANYTGRAIKPLPPVREAGRVAEVIVGVAAQPEREAFVAIGGVLPVLKAIAPGPVERKFGRLVETEHFQERFAPSTSGNLFEPAKKGMQVSGGWRTTPQHGSMSMLLLGGLAFGAIGISLLLRGSWRRTDNLAR